MYTRPEPRLNCARGARDGGACSSTLAGRRTSLALETSPPACGSAPRCCSCSRREPARAVDPRPFDRPRLRRPRPDQVRVPPRTCLSLGSRARARRDDRVRATTSARSAAVTYQTGVPRASRPSYIDTGKVRYVVRDLPLDVHDPGLSRRRSRALRRRAGQVLADAGGSQRPLSAAWPRATYPTLAAEVGLALSRPSRPAWPTTDLPPPSAPTWPRPRAAGLDRTPAFVIGRPVGGTSWACAWSAR